jgi:hypothetical protein
MSQILFVVLFQKMAWKEIISYKVNQQSHVGQDIRRQTRTRRSAPLSLHSRFIMPSSVAATVLR